MTPKRPRNPNQLAKAIIDIATGEHPFPAPLMSNAANRAHELNWQLTNQPGENSKTNSTSGYQTESFALAWLGVVALGENASYFKRVISSVVIVVRRRERRPWAIVRNFWGLTERHGLSRNDHRPS